MAVRVTAAAVQVVVGRRAHVVLAGGLLPDATSLEDVERLARKGLVVVEEPPVIEDGAEFIEGAAGSDPDAPTVEAEPVKPTKPQAPKPAAK